MKPNSIVGLAAALLLISCGGLKDSKKRQSLDAPPANSSGLAKEAAKNAAEITPPVPEPPTILRKRYVVAALGDSITSGKSGGGGYLRVLRSHCPRSVFINFGVGGDMTNQMRKRFARDIQPIVGAQGLTTLLVYGGVNDLYSDQTAARTNDRIEADLEGLYAEAHAAGLEVVAVTVSPWGGFSKYWNPRRGQNTRMLNSWILGQVARGTVDRAVDSFPLLSCGNPDALCPEYEAKFADGLHPGPRGHEILGQKLAEGAFSDCQ